VLLYRVVPGVIRSSRRTFSSKFARNISLYMPALRGVCYLFVCYLFIRLLTCDRMWFSKCTSLIFIDVGTDVWNDKCSKRLTLERKENVGVKVAKVKIQGQNRCTENLKIVHGPQFEAGLFIHQIWHFDKILHFHKWFWFEVSFDKMTDGHLSSLQCVLIWKFLLSWLNLHINNLISDMIHVYSVSKLHVYII